VLGAKSKDKAEEKRKRLEKRTKSYESFLRIEEEWADMSDEEKAEARETKEKLIRASLTMSPALVWETIKELRHAGIPYFVAPGEADHQLVHLAKTGACTCVYTIDGDLLAHGMPIIRQFSFSSGQGTVYQLPSTNDDFFLGGGRAAFTWAFFVGCDYTNGVHGIGKVKAKEIIEQCHGDFDPENVISTMKDIFPKAGDARTRTVKVPDGEDVEEEIPAISYEEFVENLRNLYRAFESAVVYDPQTKTFMALDGGTPEWQPAAHAQRYSLGILCADPLCACHTNRDHHGIGLVRNCAQDGDLNATHLTYSMVPGSWLDSDAIFQEVDHTGKIPPEPSAEELKLWLRCRSINLTQTSASGINALKGKAALLKAVQAHHRTELERAKRGDDVVLLRSEDGECLHEFLYTRGTKPEVKTCPGLKF